MYRKALLYIMCIDIEIADSSKGRKEGKVLESLVPAYMQVVKKIR